MEKEKERNITNSCSLAHWLKNKTWCVIVVTEVGTQTTAAYLLNSGETTDAFFHFTPLYCFFFLSRQETISQVNNNELLLYCRAEASPWTSVGTLAHFLNLSQLENTNGNVTHSAHLWRIRNLFVYSGLQTWFWFLHVNLILNVSFFNLVYGSHRVDPLVHFECIREKYFAVLTPFQKEETAKMSHILLQNAMYLLVSKESKQIRCSLY